MALWGPQTVARSAKEMAKGEREEVGARFFGEGDRL